MAQSGSTGGVVGAVTGRARAALGWLPRRIPAVLSLTLGAVETTVRLGRLATALPRAALQTAGGVLAAGRRSGGPPDTGGPPPPSRGPARSSRRTAGERAVGGQPRARATGARPGRPPTSGSGATRRPSPSRATGGRLTAAPPARPAEPAAPPTSPASDDLPIDDYDHLTMGSLRSRVRRLTAGELATLLDYERAHADRPQVLSLLEHRLTTVGRPSGGSVYPAEPAGRVAEPGSEPSAVDVGAWPASAAAELAATGSGPGLAEPATLQPAASEPAFGEPATLDLASAEPTAQIDGPADGEEDRPAEADPWDREEQLLAERLAGSDTAAQPSGAGGTTGSGQPPDR